MKEQVAELVNESIQELGVFVDDAYIANEEGKKIFNIVLDSEEIIDLNKITDASRIINKIRAFIVTAIEVASASPQ